MRRSQILILLTVLGTISFSLKEGKASSPSPSFSLSVSSHEPNQKHREEEKDVKLASYATMTNEEYASLFITGNNENIRKGIISMLSQIPSKDRGNFKEYAFSFFNPNMRDVNKQFVLEALTSMPIQDWVPFKEFTQSIVPNYGDWKLGDSTFLPELLSRITPSDRPAFKEFAQYFLTQGMNVDDQALVLRTLAVISIQDRGPFKEFVQLFWSFNFNPSRKAQMLSDLASIRIQDRPAFKDFAVSLMPGDIREMHEVHQFRFIKALLSIRTEDRLNFKQRIDEVLALYPMLLEDGSGLMETTCILSEVLPANRTQFVDFCRQNNVAFEDIGELSRVPNPQDWPGTLRAIRARAQFGGQPQVVGIANQSVHDKAFETSIKKSVEKLQRLYGAPSVSVESLVKIIVERMESLQKKSLLQPVEVRVIDVFLKGTQGLDEDARSKITLYLYLAWQALNDEKEAAKALGREPKQEDMDERVASWLRSGPMDAQLAYILDNLGQGQFKDKKTLLEALSKNFDHVVGAGKSCLGGSFNRLISGLDVIHPLVVIDYGEATKSNADLYALRNALQKQGREFLDKTMDQNISDDARRSLVIKQLQDFMTASQKNYAFLKPFQIEATFKAYVEQDFEKELLSKKGLDKIQAYIHGDGMRHEMRDFIAQQDDSFATDILLKKAKEDVMGRIEAQLKMLSYHVGKEDRASLIAEAQAYVPGIITEHQKNLLNAIALRKLKELPDRLPMQEDYAQKVSRKDAIIKYLMGEIVTVLKRHNFVNERNKKDIDEMIESVLREDALDAVLENKALSVEKSSDEKDQKAYVSSGVVPEEEVQKELSEKKALTSAPVSQSGTK